MKDGPDNIRYILVDKTHPSYQRLHDAFLAEHRAKQADNVLTVVTRNDEKQAVIKVVGRVGWLNRFDAQMRNDRTDGLILRVYRHDELTELHNTVLGTEAWVKER